MNRNKSLLIILLYLMSWIIAVKTSVQANIFRLNSPSVLMDRLSFIPTITPYPQFTSTVQYEIQSGTPLWLGNFTHPDKGCDVILVAGQVFDLNSKPVTLIVVEVGGLHDNQVISQLSLTGIAPSYGPGGYEVVFTDLSIAKNKLWIKLYDLSGNPLSSVFYFNVSNECGKNLALVNFVQITESNIKPTYFLPIVFNN